MLMNSDLVGQNEVKVRVGTVDNRGSGKQMEKTGTLFQNGRLKEGDSH